MQRRPGRLQSVSEIPVGLNSSESTAARRGCPEPLLLYHLNGVHGPVRKKLHASDERFPSLGSQNPDVKKNPGGSYDIHFGPKAPQGKERKWAQTVPGKGWFIILRIYGPLEPWFDKTWQPGEIELVQ
jgi:hypothetical protein